MKIEEYQHVWKIWLESKDMLYKYNLARFKDEELAKDVVQDTLLKMYTACCSNRDIKNVKSWMFQISHNAALDRIKKENKHRELPVMPSEDEETEVWSSISNFLEPLIGFLPDKYGIPLKMSDVDGMPQKEIADHLGLQLSATKSRIQRARQLLKSEIMTCYTLKLDKNGVPVQAELRSDCEPLQQLNKKE